MWGLQDVDLYISNTTTKGQEQDQLQKKEVIIKVTCP
jgi:hypothetical protein